MDIRAIHKALGARVAELDTALRRVEEEYRRTAAESDKNKHPEIRRADELPTEAEDLSRASRNPRKIARLKALLDLIARETVLLPKSVSAPYVAHKECGGAIATPGATTGVPSGLQAELQDISPPYCSHGVCWCSRDARGRGRIAPVGHRRGSSHNMCRGISEFLRLHKELPNAVPDGFDEFMRYLDASARTVTQRQPTTGGSVAVDDGAIAREGGRTYLRPRIVMEDGGDMRHRTGNDGGPRDKHTS